MSLHKEEGRLPFPYEIVNVDLELNLQLMKDFTGERTGFIQVGPKKYLYPSRYAKEAESIYNFAFKNDDVVLVTIPRSGSTWTQEMLWLICNDLNYQKAKESVLDERFPWLETSIVFHEDIKQELLSDNKTDLKYYEYIQEIDHPCWEKLSTIRDRRFIKTHLPFSLLPPNLTKIGCKIIYVIRNPKDVAVSLYHLSRSMKTIGYMGDFPKFWDYFERNLTVWAPYWEHVKEGWSRRHEENVLVLFYEDMKKDLGDSIEKAAVFFGKSYTTEELKALEKHLHFDNFKTNESVNYDYLKTIGIYLNSEQDFIRKGKVGGWKGYFDKELEKRADEWIENNLKDTDLKFPV